MKSLLSAITFTVPTSVGGQTNFSTLIVNVTNILLFIAGTVAVIFIIVGGIMYATSAGNEQNVTRAKSTITNAVIGLVIAILAFTIVNFVLNIFK